MTTPEQKAAFIAALYGANEAIIKLNKLCPDEFKRECGDLSVGMCGLFDAIKDKWEME